MALSRFLALALVGGASSWSIHSLAAPRAVRTSPVTMFEEPPKSAEDVAITTVTRSREVGLDRQGSMVVTDDSGSFYGSRTIFTMLNDFGRYASIKAVSDSVVDAKKALISRAGRYSGLLDVLSFHEGEPSAAFEGAASWLAINADESTIGPKIDAAAAAGVSRVFVLISDAVAASDALETQLKASGMAYTIMRVGKLVGTPSGVGYKLGELDLPVCEDVAKEDVRAPRPASHTGRHATCGTSRARHRARHPAPLPLSPLLTETGTGTGPRPLFPPRPAGLPFRHRSPHPRRRAQSCLLPLPLRGHHRLTQGDAPLRL